MRGAQWCDFGRDCRGGIIPADAGSTPTTMLRWPKGQDHPRGCGEHRLYVGMDTRAKGSSPRMRGAPKRVLPGSRPVGIIPADAGSTPPPAHAGRPEPDHPRGCGEHREINGLYWHTEGSSPRMRGAPGVHLADPDGRRIIPADAGSTRSQFMKQCPIRDHPRGCGEHNLSFWNSFYNTGSSPRMRGARYE